MQELIKVSQEEFNNFIKTFDVLYYQKIRFSSPVVENYFKEKNSNTLVARVTDSYGVKYPKVYEIGAKIG